MILIPLIIIALLLWFIWKQLEQIAIVLRELAKEAKSRQRYSGK